MKDTLGVLLAGGAGRNVFTLLTRDRAKPAVTFGGIYRIIDITLSKTASTPGLHRVYILTQYKGPFTQPPHFVRA